MGTQKQDGLSFATLRAAEAAIETKSLTGAAQKLGISQPAISMHLSRLEKAIGTPLIKKLGNRIIIKDEISVLIRQMLDLERRLRAVGFEKNLSKLKVGVCTYCAPLLLSGLERLGRIRELVSWRIADSKRLEEMYDLGQVDAVFRALYPSELGPDLVTDYALRWVGSRRIREQLQHGNGALPVVLTSRQSPVGSASRDWLRMHGVSYDVVGEVDDVATAVRLVSSGIALSPLPGFVFDDPDVVLDDCSEILPGSLDIRYGMFLMIGASIFAWRTTFSSSCRRSSIACRRLWRRATRSIRFRNWSGGRQLCTRVAKARDRLSHAVFLTGSPCVPVRE